MVLSLLLFLIACVGNIILAIGTYNWWYAQALPILASKLIRLVYALGMLGFPLLLWYLIGFDVLGTLTLEHPAALTWLMMLYVAVCLTVALVIFPFVTVRRWLRLPPVCLLSNHTESCDIAAELNHPPIGRTYLRHFGRLPLNEIFRVDFSEKTLRLPRLPAAWDGLSILHLSDLHLIGTPDRTFFQRVMDHCNEWEPDLIALTGDVVDSDHHRRWIVPVLGRLRCKMAAFAILGNHDRWWEPPLIRRRLQRVGMRYLGNSWQQIDVRGEPLVVIGHEGPWFRPAPDLKLCPEGPFRLCLSHTPDNIRWAQRHGIDLMLSGHNHGGQVRLPLIGSVFVPSSFGRRYDCGTFHEPPTLLHVSRGLGAEHPVRFNCPPEVTRLVLRAV